MSELKQVSETLYIPLQGRIFVSEHFPEILYDKALLSIKNKLPKKILNMQGQSEYTLVASAARSVNMDYYVQKFLKEYPEGIIVNAGCGLESIFFRNDNGRAQWYEMDFPEVLEYRREIFPETTRDYFLPYSIFDVQWIEEVKKISGEKAVLVLASGLFHFFKEEDVLSFIKSLERFSKIELVFDAVNSYGIKRSRKYVEKMGKKVEMFFYVDDAKIFAKKVSDNCQLLEEAPFYKRIYRCSRLSFMTKFYMWITDKFRMVKMVHLSFNRQY